MNTGTPRDAVSGAPHAAPSGDITPGKVGRYLIIQQIGTGGMGVVYKAYDPELDRKVAVKLLLPGRSTVAQERLAKEARVMARVSHPNVVPIHDVGAVDGRMFIAMEFVDGNTLTEWLHVSRRTWQEIVDVFIAAAAGLAAAHEKGVVHRDFKPDNVLVDRKGRAQVTDFGIAVGLATYSTAELETASTHNDRQVTRLTREGATVGTPAYMAPEQFQGGEIGAHSDQFSFCVALWEALWKQRPFAGATPAELAWTVTHGAITQPPRSSVPPHIQAALLRGLSLHPSRRWPSITALAAELRREPGRRRRRILLGAGLVATIGAGFVGAHLERANRCNAVGEEILESWNDDLKRDIEAKFMATSEDVGVSTFGRVAAHLDAYADALMQQSHDTCEANKIRGEQSDEVAQLRRQCIEERLARLDTLVDAFSNPDRVTVLHSVKAVLKLPPAADCADIKMLHQNAPPPPPPGALEEIAAARRSLARAESLRDTGRYEDAQAIIDQVLIGEAAGDYARLNLGASILKGSVLHVRGLYDESAAALQRTYFDALRASEDAIAAEAATLLVLVFEDKAAFDQAMSWIAHARAEAARIESSGLRTADLDVYEARVHMSRADYRMARDLLLSAIGTYERVVGPDHVTVAQILNSLAHVEVLLGQHEAARVSLKRALVVHESMLGDHPLTAATIHNLGNVSSALGDDVTARQCFQRALAMRRQFLGANHRDVLATTGNLATTLAELGEHEEAKDLLRSTLDAQVAANGGERHPDVARLYNSLGTHAGRTGDYAAARTYFETALRIYEEVYGLEHPTVAEALNNLANVYGYFKEYERAKAVLERSISIAEKAKGPEHLELAAPNATLGQVLLQMGRHGGAINALRRSIALREKAATPPWSKSEAQFALAKALWSVGNPAEAREAAERSIEGYEAQVAAIPALAEKSNKRAAEVREWLSSVDESTARRGHSARRRTLSKK